MVNEIGRDGLNLTEGFKKFYNAIFDCDCDFENLPEYKEYKKMLHDYLLAGYYDFDVEIFISYQVEPIGSKNTETKYKNCGSICDIAERGITLPSDVTKLTISAKPAIRNHGNGMVAKTTLRNKSLFSKTIIVSRDKEVDNAGIEEKTVTKFNIPEDVFVLNYEDLSENSKLIRFNKPKEIEI